MINGLIIMHTVCSHVVKYLESKEKHMSHNITYLTIMDWITFVLRFYGPVNPFGSCRARSVYLTTLVLGRLRPLSG